MKKCPFCAEEIRSEAIKCRYCGERLDTQQHTATGLPIRQNQDPFIESYFKKFKNVVTASYSLFFFVIFMYVILGGDSRQNILAAGFIGILILLGYIGIMIMSGYFWYYLWNAARLVGKRPLHYLGLSIIIPIFGPVIAYSMLKKYSTEYYRADNIAHQGKGFAIIWGTIALIAVIGIVAAVIIPQLTRQQQKPVALDKAVAPAPGSAPSSATLYTPAPLPAPVARPAPPPHKALLDKYKGDPYAMLADPNYLSDKQFKKFVDKYGSGVPGIGYVDNGKGGITRIIERP